jgi:site-specific DNA-methyltransferase (adenine-specific)
LPTLISGDAFVEILNLPNNSVDLCLTDPPYGLDRLTPDWSVSKVNDKRNQQVVTSLPAGMKFDRQQSYRLQEWMTEISSQILAKLKPGAFFFCFSSPRLYHRTACAIEDAGFLIRDQYEWLYTQNQPKAMSLFHFVERRKYLTEKEKDQLIHFLDGWKTPQIKSNHEPICVAQKPLNGTFLDNYIEHEVGLVNTKEKIGIDGSSFPSNLLCDEESPDLLQRHFLVPKPTKTEKGEFNFHKTVKPLGLCEYLIRLTTRPGQVVLDPFAGSGTTLVAAQNAGRDHIGIELNHEYIEIINRRLKLPDVARIEDDKVLGRTETDITHSFDNLTDRVVGE